MGTNNQKYTNYRVIMGRVARIMSLMNMGGMINEDDIIEWTAECEIDYIADYSYFVKFRQVPLTVANCIAKLPCNVYRIEDVYLPSGNVPYYNDGAYLRLPEDFRGTVIYINYIGIPVDNEGIPLILKGHEQANVSFCVLQLLTPLHMAGQLKNPNVYAEYTDKVNYQCHAAKNGYRHKDRAAVNQEVIVWGNTIPKIGGLLLAHEAFEERGIGGLNA